LTQFSRPRGIMLKDGWGNVIPFVAGKGAAGRGAMTAINRKKVRLRLILGVALALGACSAALSGTLSALASDQSRSAFVG
jgi:hypothetical protein